MTTKTTNSTQGVQLGDEALDVVTGFKGVCIARTAWLNGCVRLTLQGPMDKDGKVPESVTIDEPQLAVTRRAKVVMPVSDAGGPIPSPRRPPSPTR